MEGKQMADSQSDTNVFSVRIVSIDYYMAPPIPGFDICYSSFQGGKVNEVPVIRIYGSTPAGQKTCLHIHRALPYLYVPCEDLLPQPHQEGDACTHLISLAVEKALKLKGNAGLKRQHVHGCSLVRAKKFYGYHSSEELFAKIYLSQFASVACSIDFLNYLLVHYDYIEMQTDIVLEYATENLDRNISYYPHDVSRAANLLLGGAVLDRSLQPHESHIPFLLQFLVDYNLYGMGHLHVTTMKFRHPVPTTCSRKKVPCIGELGKGTDNSTCSYAHFQVESSETACFGSPVWISSTIPDGWTWQFPSQSDASSGQDTHLVRRQSTCELEGDTTVDEILNQQSKMYSPLSQTCSDVKMVQSLMPIWEEYARTGKHDGTIPSDNAKPLPADVLRTLSYGLVLENKLMELCSEGENYRYECEKNARFAMSANCTTDEKNMVEPELGNPKNGHVKNSNSFGVSTKLGSVSSQGSPCEEDDGTIPSDVGNVLLKQLPVHEMLTSEKVGTSDQKVADKEALRLLKWLASSQSADDVNSDDELLCETILSPLLPAATIDKVLHKASLDYESESQQECQDILDSIEDSINFEVLNGGSSFSIDGNDARQSENTIPQVDGSADDQDSIPNIGKSSNLGMDNELEMLSRDKVWKEAGSNFAIDQHKKNKPLWGSLPFSLAQVVDGDIQPVSTSMTVACGSETKYDAVQSCQAETGIFWNASACNSKLAACDSKEASSLTGCSIRDLMRRKRCYRAESSESMTHRVKKTHSEEEQNDLFSNPERLDFYAPQNNGLDKCLFERANSWPSFTCELSDFNKWKSYTETVERLQQTDTTTVSCLSGVPMESEILHRCAYVCKKGNENSTFFPTISEMPSENKGIEMTTGTTVYGGEQHGRAMVSAHGSLAFPVLDIEANPGELIGMTFHSRPPMVDLADGTLENGSTYINHALLGDKENYDGLSVQGVVSDEYLSFFEGGCLEEKESQSKSCRNDDSDHHQEAVMGVPTHYQNDGSFLYLLTPLFAPPSVDTVDRWLLHEDAGILGDKFSATSAEPSSPKGSSCDQFILRGSPVDVCKKPSLQSSSMCELKPIQYQLNQQTHGNFNAEITDFNNKVTTRNEGKDAKEGTDYSQDLSQISGPDSKSKLTPLSQIGFRDPASVGGGEQLTLLSVEIQADSRGDLRPDPRFDAINVIVLVFQEDNDNNFIIYVLLRSKSEHIKRNFDGVSGCKVLVSSQEKQLFNQFISIICTFDPDILMGWDIQGGSLGFLAERASYLGIGLLDNISRAPSGMKVVARVADNALGAYPEPSIVDSVLAEGTIIEDEWGRTHASGVHVGGRVVLNIWRLMRGELKLNMYTIEAVAENVLRRKIPSIHYKILTKWFSSGPGRARHQCIEYVVKRAKLNLEIMNQLDMISRTSELARIFGIDFFSVLSRGSQYRVESMLLRLAHTQNYIAISPGNQQVASQPAMECLPLVMEPESGFYADPVIVLDFQSLYPSMIIAYNLCFCTCLGSITPSKAKTLGVSSFSLDEQVLQDLKNEVLITPNGVMYVPSKVHKGVLPRLLEEILSTRIMVKQAMKKLAPSQQILYRIFNARQLALKLISNVTYGYTAAGFSGRMPCAELADSIVQCGRRTLENAISFVNAHDKWKAKVIYGDTDSIFVHLKGRSVKESFQIGHEIASAVTAMNPHPVVLKMEKVYHPCFLLTKKRYVGYSFESPDQIKPVFDAKGIETVRRDTCGAVAKMMEQSLRLFFEQQDIIKVKAYLQRQWTRILSGRVSLEDFVFAKEVRLGTYSSRASSSLPPAAIVATKAMRVDPRAEPRYAERIPYVVVHGEPGSRLVDMVVDPLDLLAIDSPFRLNGLYYISKQIIPALQRIFGLVGADLNQWFADLPRPGREAITKRHSYAPNSHRTRIDYYYLSKHCVLCGELVQASAHICGNCSKNEAAVATALVGRTSKLEREIQHLIAICQHCGGGDSLMESGVTCTSLACSVFYERWKVQKELQSLSAVAFDAGLYPRCMVEWF